MNVINMSNWTAAVNTVRGRVKWFDPVKGYGFVVVPGLPEDVLLHANSIEKFGQSSITPDAEIKCFVEEKSGRYRATEVIECTPALEDLPPELDIAESELVFQPARTKWYCSKKSYGFVEAYKTPGDIFIGQSVLNAAGLTKLSTGEAVSIATKTTEKGLVAVKVSPWR